MIAEIVVPVFPESINDGTLSAVHKKVGENVFVGDVIADVETDKVMFEVPSTVDGVVEEVMQEMGVTVKSGEVIARIKEQKMDENSRNKNNSTQLVNETNTGPSMSPSAEKMVRENNINITQLTGSGKDGRIIKEDVISVTAGKDTPSQEHRSQQRVPMTRLRSRIAERLLEAQHNAAILTTFNEIDMHAVINLRNKYREKFEKTHAVRLGFMSFFIKAAVEALIQFPQINASIDGSDIVYHGFIDMGIAVGSPRGLVVPVLRDAQTLSVANIEKQIVYFSERATTGKLSLQEITGGTFSITNGGVFGSMLSTPIINPPQSAILGMHKIEKRVIVINDEMLIRPIMYVALSYDHRIIDGREAVQFLVTIKQHLEDPASMLLGI